MSKVSLVFLALLLTGCSTGIPLSKYAPQGQPRTNFTFCHGYSCTYREQTGFTDKEWAMVQKIFRNNPAKTPEGERSKIAAAIAQMERVIGPKTGTEHDEGQATAIKKDAGQMDCLDETVDTSRYLSFLYQDGLLKFYKPADPVHRGYIIDGRWPHNTATIADVKTGERFVVDSFYRPNGQEPYIVPADQWLSGWRPPGATQ